MIAVISRLFRRRRKDFAGISTENLERFLAQAEAGGLDSSADHYRWILARRKNRGAS